MKKLLLGLVLFLFLIACQNNSREEFIKDSPITNYTEDTSNYSRIVYDTIDASKLEIVEIDNEIPAEILSKFNNVDDVNLTSLTRVKIKLGEGKYADIYSSTKNDNHSIAYVLPVIDGTLSSMAQLDLNLNGDYTTVIGTTTLGTFFGSGLNEDGECSYSGVNGYGQCLAQCVSCVLDTNGLAGQVIAVSSIAAGVGCSGCGVAAAVVFGIGLVGCGGGCVGY